MVRQYRVLRSLFRVERAMQNRLSGCSRVPTHGGIVVDARRQRSARRELKQSKKRLPTEASLQLVTWQSLFRILKAENTAIPGGLCSTGRTSKFPASIRSTASLTIWRQQRTFKQYNRGDEISDRARPHFREASTIKLAQATELQGWRLSEDPEGEISLYSIDPGI